MDTDSRQAGTRLKITEMSERQISEIERILYEQIELAKPDDLAFLESQVPMIAEKLHRSLSA